MKRLAAQLGISPQEVNSWYTVRCTDQAAVTAANRDILSDWLKRQNSREEAYVIMVGALTHPDVGLNLIAREVLKYPPFEWINKLKSAQIWV